jgi:cell shape-determining protein MreC
MGIQNQNNNSLLIAGILLVSFVLFLLDISGGLSLLHNTRLYVTTPLKYFTSQFSDGIRNMSQNLFFPSQLRSENLQLRARILELEQQIEDTKLASRVCNEFTAEKNIANQSGLKKFVIATVLDKSYNNISGTFLIDKGSNSQIKQGQFVIAQNSFVGQVENVFTFTSVVRTVFSPGIQVKSIFPQKKISGLLARQGNSLFITDILLSEDVVEKDTAYAIIDNTPYRFRIGNVSLVENNVGDSSKRALVIPAIELDQINSVTVIQE